MYCPRCGRQVNANANFCGGCGLSKKEIDEQLAATNTYNYTEPVFEKAPPKTGEVESFMEQPFPTDVEFKDVEEFPDEAALPKEESCSPDTQDRYEPSQDQYEPSQDQFRRSQNQYEPSQDQFRRSQEDTVQKHTGSENMSTVDFVWAILLSLIPGINIIYLTYLAFIQKNSIIKRSYARAALIIGLFILLILVMFAFGFVVANMIY